MLASFYAGLLGESGRVAEGRANHDAFNTVQDRLGVIPSAVDYATKYYWLLFSDTPRFDYQNNYLNT